MATLIKLSRRPAALDRNRPDGVQEVYDPVFEGVGYPLVNGTSYEDDNDLIVDVRGLYAFYFQLINKDETVEIQVKVQRTNKQFTVLDDLTDDDFVDDSNFVEEVVPIAPSVTQVSRADDFQAVRLTPEATAYKIRLNTQDGGSSAATGVFSGT